MVDHVQHPGQAAARLLGPAGPGLLLLVVFAVGLGAVSVLTWLGSYGGKAVAVALANLAAAAAVNVGLFLLVFRVLTPRQIPTSQLLAGALVAGVAWQVLQAVGGYLVGHYLRHTSQVYGVFAIVLGLLFWLYLGARGSPCTVRRRSQRRGRPAALAAQPAPTTIGQHQPIRRSG